MARPIVARVATALLLLQLFVVARLAGFGLPLPWPDEALFASPALALLDHGRLATDAMTGLLPGIEAHTYWQPPLYFLFLALVFKCFGASLGVLRASTLATALVVCVLTARIAGQLVARAGTSGRGAIAMTWALPCILLFLTLDPIFIRGALVGRMDMLSLVFTLAALLASAGASRTSAFFAGVLAGLALTTHPLGLAALPAVVVTRFMSIEFDRRTQLVLVAAGLTLVVIPWAAYVGADPHAFIAQVRAQLSRKAGTASARPISLYFEFLSDVPLTRVTELVWIVLGVIGIARAERSPLRIGCLTVIGVAFPIVLMSGEFWYLLVPLPFAAMGMFVLLAHAPARVVAIAAACLAMDAFALARGVSRARASDTTAFSSAIRRRVLDPLPDGSLVVFDSVPDVEIGNIDLRARLQLRQFSPVPIDGVRYRSLVDQAVVVIATDPPPDGKVLDFVREPEWRSTSVSAGGFTARVFFRPDRASVPPP